MQLFTLLRLAGSEVGLLVTALAILLGVAVVAWKLIRIVLVAALVVVLWPFALLARPMGLPAEPASDAERDARERARQNAERFFADAFRLSDGGKYGRQRRWNRAITARLADPDGLNHRVVDYLPGGSRNKRY